MENGGKLSAPGRRMGSGIKYGVGPAGANGNRMGDGLWDPGCSVSASDLSPFGIKYGVGPAGANGNRMGDGLWDPGCSVSASDLSPFVYQSKVPSSGEIVGGRRLGQLAK